ncbi:hypothetical protein C7B62_08470 [Pleurocapsa sp. CCALA 161]|nr:hypothetical protein C7B62_08470 [Pleurocapsa sp. CCALA 161]
MHGSSKLLEEIVPSLVTERIESVKAGLIGAGAFTLAKLLFLAAQDLSASFIPALHFNAGVMNGIWRIELAIEIAIGVVSGFLFGVTYRYVIRSDRNSHLKDGAVLAFGLVRGLALVETNLVLSELLSLGGLVLQSIVCFAIARLILDLAILRKLIKPFT